MPPARRLLLPVLLAAGAGAAEAQFNEAARHGLAKTLLPRLDPIEVFAEYTGPLNLTSHHYAARTAFVGVVGLGPAVRRRAAAWGAPPPPGPRTLTRTPSALSGARRPVADEPAPRRPRPRPRSRPQVLFLLMWLGFGLTAGVRKYCYRGPCCPTPSIHGYSRLQQQAPKYATAAITLLFLGGGGVVLYWGQKVMQGGTKLEEILTQEGQVLQGSGAMIVDSLLQVGDSPFVDVLKDQADKFNAALTVVLDRYGDVTSVVSDVMSYGRLALIVGASLLCLQAVFGFIAKFLKKPTFLFLCIMLSIVFCFLAWVLFGAAFALDIVIRDVCSVSAGRDYKQNWAASLPCLAAPPALAAAEAGKGAIVDIVEGVNGELLRIGVPGRSGGAYQNLCSPYLEVTAGNATSYEPVSCEGYGVRLQDFDKAGPQGYAEWICGSSKSAGNCAQTRADVPYNKLRDDATRAAGMFKVVQTAEDLAVCSTVDKIVYRVNDEYCRDAVENSLFMSIGFLAMCVSYTILVALHFINSLRSFGARKDAFRAQHQQMQIMMQQMAVTKPPPSAIPSVDAPSSLIMGMDDVPLPPGGGASSFRMPSLPPAPGGMKGARASFALPPPPGSRF